jgi:hypothetical protein
MINFFHVQGSVFFYSLWEYSTRRRETWLKATEKVCECINFYFEWMCHVLPVLRVVSCPEQIDDNFLFFKPCRNLLKQAES